MKIIFFGSDHFALVSLKRITEWPNEVVACVTPPDRARGRGLKVTACDVKSYAQAKDIPVLQPEKLRNDELIRKLKSYAPDLFVVIAYGKILPLDVLMIPKICALNVHGSLLPKYRGAAPINWAIINGDQETGISVIKMNEAMDGGDVIARRSMPIAHDDTSVTLRSRMADEGADLLTGTIRAIEKDEYSLTQQDYTAVTLAPKLTKDLGHINWQKPAIDIHRLIRGLLPWPTAFTYWRNKLLKIIEADISDCDSAGSPAGTIIRLSKEGFVVNTGQGTLLVKQVHLESAKPMPAASFVAGHHLRPGERLA